MCFNLEIEINFAHSFFVEYQFALSFSNVI